MKRRDALKSLFGLSVAAAVAPLPSFASIAKSDDLLVQNGQLFNRALHKHPELIGFVGTESNFEPSQLTLEGKLPGQLNFDFYRNGPGIHQRQGKRYSHLFEGDGMIQHFRFQSGKVHHQGRFVETPKYVAEQDAGQFLFSGPDSKLQQSRAITKPDSINTANTNVIPVNGELWALWEAGSATALNSDTLATKGVVELGKNNRYGQSLSGLAFSAHPKIEADGTIWNFGTTITGDVVLYHLNRLGIVKNVGLIKTSYRGAMLHDFLITKNNLLIILPSLVQNKTKAGFFESIEYKGSLPMQALVIDKTSLQVKQTFELPPGFAFHYGNAYEDSQGNIHFDASLYADGSTLHYMSALMRGDNSHPAPGYTTLFTLYKNGQVKHNHIDGISEFPRVYNHLTGEKNNLLITLSSVESDVWSDSVRTVNIATGKQDIYTYGKDFLVEEHVVVDDSGIEGEGYLVGTALHIPSKRTCVNVFKANRLSDGPICRGWLPHVIPLGFHGNVKLS